MIFALLQPEITRCGKGVNEVWVELDTVDNYIGNDRAAHDPMINQAVGTFNSKPARKVDPTCTLN